MIKPVNTVKDLIFQQDLEPLLNNCCEFENLMSKREYTDANRNCVMDDFHRF